MSEYFEYKELSEHQKVDISGHVSGFGGCFGGDCRTANVAPNTIIEKAPYFFANCEELEVVNFGENVDVHGNNVFQNCFSLIELNLSEGLRVLGNATFAGCGFLRLVIKSGTIFEGPFSFGNCTNLYSVEFGDDCKILGDSTFEGCLNLESVIGGNNLQILGKDTFKNCPKFESIYAGNNSVIDY
jgi:hypothetical protein